MIRPIASSWFAQIVRLERHDHRGHGFLDPAFDRLGAGARGDVLPPLAIDRLCEHGRGRGAVAGDVGCLARDFLDHLRTHVLDRILQVDFARNRDAVLRDRRCAKRLAEDDVAPLGAEGHLDRIRQAVDSAEQRVARRLAIDNLFGHQDSFRFCLPKLLMDEMSLCSPRAPFLESRARLPLPSSGGRFRAAARRAHRGEQTRRQPFAPSRRASAA